MNDGQRQRVVVIGQGYVGLPLAVAAAEAGHVVTGVDRDKRRVEQLGEGVSPTADIADERLRAVLSDRYFPSNRVEAVGGADVVIICVPTPYRDQAPDLSYIEGAAEELASNLRGGTLVVLESTTFPGTTEEIVRPILERGSGLSAVADFDLAFSPERIDPGNPTFDIHNTPKVVGGVTPSATKRSAEFYRSFVNEVIELSGPTAAEMTKLLENTFRHINIALVNELAIACRDLGVDVWEVIRAADSKPFGFMAFYPGPGVGGHCIPVDPLYLSWRLRQFGGGAKFIDLARDVNAAMPLYCVGRVQELLNEQAKALKGSSVLVIGVAYKPNVADLRESPALAFITGLVKRGAVVSYHDPYIPELELSDGRVCPSIALTPESLCEADCVVVLTHHESVDYAHVARYAALVFDTRNVVPRAPHVARL